MKGRIFIAPGIVLVLSAGAGAQSYNFQDIVESFHWALSPTAGPGVYPTSGLWGGFIYNGPTTNNGVTLTLSGFADDFAIPEFIVDGRYQYAGTPADVLSQSLATSGVDTFEFSGVPLAPAGDTYALYLYATNFNATDATTFNLTTGSGTANKGIYSTKNSPSLGTPNDAFSEGVNYVLFDNVVPLNGVVSGTVSSGPIGLGGGQGDFNGAQLVAVPTSTSTGGNITVAPGNNMVFNGSTSAGSVVLQSGSTASIATPSGTPCVVQVSSLSIGANSTFDIGNNELLINYGVNADPISTIQSYLAGSGIISSMVASLNAGQGSPVYGIGYADSADGIVSGLSSGQIEIMPALAGDAKLEGDVDFGDFQILTQFFGQSGGWDEGNFTGGSTIDFADFQLLSQNFGANSAALTSAEIASLNGFAAQFGDELAVNSDGVGFSLVSVPEPMSAGLLVVGASALLLRRKRK
jgi:hypothetical protein